MQNLLDFSGRKKAPLILQTEAAECGLACLAMIASYHGHRVDLASLRQKFSMSLKGSTLNHLIRIADQLHLASRPVRVDLNELSKLSLPAVLHWDFNHFVVLTQVKRGVATLKDPAKGMLNLPYTEVSKHFTGIALELAPTQAFTPKTERQQIKLFRLIGQLDGASSATLQIILLAAAIEVFAIVAPFFMQLVVDNAVVARDSNLLTVLGLGFLLLALIQTAITALRSWVVMVLSTSVNLQMMSNLFGHLLQLPMSFFEKRHLGDIVSRFESLNVIQRTLTTSFLEAIVDGAMALVTLAMMLIYSWKLAAVVSLAALLYGLLRLGLFTPLRAATEEQILRSAKQQTNLLETVRGMQSVKLFNRQLQRRSGYQNLMVDHFNAGIRVQKLNIVYRALNSLLFGVENIAVIWMGALFILDGGFSVGMLFAFMSFKDQFTHRVGSFIEKGIEFKMLGLHTERVADVALAETEADPFDGSSHADLPASIQIRNLNFSYAPSEPPVLKNLNLDFTAGESVAIVGPSGYGKTTLAKLILGLLQPTGGEILIGGVRLSQINAHDYRNMVAAVMQEDQLFAGSIADNICFFDPEPDQARIETCAQLAAVHQDIAAMPMTYNTLIGDMGTVLSGGQKQRVLLARALYKRPKILVLDEATSHLDVARERLVNGAVQQLKLTRIIIAHRPETIASVDRVIDLQAIAEQEQLERQVAA
ncbi:peptidase domain-containing ABC transporter [Methylomonas montana]|uniref:peptidase domain-containing ABC transporter n=1 Tax=Methylomonas montana TaxID=3058963 RepID=UPI002659CF5A|nr:peptidase domain-containing ABC transporter [Methylomonas montana]WKJ88860.1 peptidase domain-containing ABC transporter [Methylomonas montana]